MTDTPQFDKERQGGRVVMRVPVEIRATDADGQPLEESTFTGVVGASGAMIWTSRKLQIGSELEITNRFSQQTEKFRVAWTNDQESGKPWQTGVESLKPLEDFWGVRFPSKPSHT